MNTGFHGRRVSLLGGMALVLALGACASKRKDAALEKTASELSTRIQGVVRGGRGSGVVGGPLEGVTVTATANARSVGPVITDPSGGFVLDTLPLFPPGTQADPEALNNVVPINIDLHLHREGFYDEVETLTVPVKRFEEFTFYMKGQGKEE